MKNKFFQKLFSISVLMCTLLTLIVLPAEAAVSLPVTEDFNSRELGSYMDSFGGHDKDGNLLGTRYEPEKNGFGITYSTLEADGNTLSIVDGGEGHGYALKSKQNGKLGTDIFGWIFNPVDAGKILVKFDMKSKRRIGFNVAAGSSALSNGWGYNSNVLLKVSNNTIYPDADMGVNPISFENDQWQTISMIIDVDNRKSVNYIDGQFGEYDFNSSFIKDFENVKKPVSVSSVIIWVAAGTEESGTEDGVYFDNLVIKKLDSLDASVELYDGNNKIDENVSEIEKLFLSVEEGFDRNIDNITVTDLGSNVIALEKTNIPVTTELQSDGRILLTFAEPLKNYHSYRIKLPDGVTTSIGRGIANNEFDISVSTSLGESEEVLEYDFSDIATSDLTRANFDTAISQESPVYYDAMWGDYEIVEDSAYTGGKGLKIGDGGAVYVKFPSDSPIKSGKVKLEAKYKVLSGTVDTLYGNSNAAVNLVKTGTNATTVFYQNASNTSVMKNELWASGADGNISISYEIDIDKKSIPSFTVNGKSGQRGENEMPFYLQGNNILTGGLERVKFDSGSNGGEMVLDYVRLSRVYKTPYLKGVSFEDNEKSFEYFVGDKISPEINKIRLEFSEEMDLNSLKNIAITDNGDGSTISHGGKFNTITNVYELVPDNYLKENGEYTLTIPTSVCNKAGKNMAAEVSGKIKTGEGRYEITSLGFCDTLGNPISDLNSAENDLMLKATVTNTKALEKKYSLVYTGRKDLLLTEMTYKDFEINAEDRKTELMLPITVNKDNVTSISGYLWSDMKNALPQYTGVTLK